MKWCVHFAYNDKGDISHIHHRKIATDLDLVTLNINFGNIITRRLSFTWKDDGMIHTSKGDIPIMLGKSTNPRVWARAHPVDTKCPQGWNRDYKIKE